MRRNYGRCVTCGEWYDVRHGRWGKCRAVEGELRGRAVVTMEVTLRADGILCPEYKERK